MQSPSEPEAAPRRSIVVVGGANLDIRARCADAVVPLTSNPGISTTRPGGVGRNIAENLARLGNRVQLVAPLGRDAFGAQIQAHAQQCGIEVVAPRATSGRTGSYLAVLDASGELVVAVSDMAITDALRPRDLEVLPRVLAGADMLVLDANIPPEAAAYAMETAAAQEVPVTVEPVSVAKAGRLADVLARYGAFAVNLNIHELSVLAARPVPDTDAGVAAAAAELRSRGVRHVWVHRGRQPSVLSSQELADFVVIDPPPVPVVDVTGGGDAMAAGFVHALLRGDDPVAAAGFGQMLGALTVTTHDTVLQGLRPGVVDAALAGVDPPPEATDASAGDPSSVPDDDEEPA